VLLSSSFVIGVEVKLSSGWSKGWLATYYVVPIISPSTSCCCSSIGWEVLRFQWFFIASTTEKAPVNQ
jgi:hypothetical protein